MVKPLNAFLAAAFLLFGATARAADESALYKDAPGPYTVASELYDWHDARRNRDVPVKIYHPDGPGGPWPVIIFSHGLGGSREGYAYLGRRWASQGYVVVHLQHIGSDTSVWVHVAAAGRMKALREAAANLQNAMDRPADVSFALDQIEKMNSSGPVLEHRLDLAHVGMAGHSFGAFTTLAIAGQVFVSPTGVERSEADPRVKAAIAMSATPPASRKHYDETYAKIRIPIFHMTGTLDSSPIGGAEPADRRIPFDHIRGADQYLVTFDGADHMVFSGRMVEAGRGERDALFQKYILSASTAFWDAYLKGEEPARSWLTGNGFTSSLGDVGKFEKKLQDRAK